MCVTSPLSLRRVRPSLGRYWAFCLLFLLSCGSGGGGVYEPVPSALNSSAGSKFKAPAFHVKDIQGSWVNLENFKGRVVFIDFWATWCPPCLISMPAVEELRKDYEGRNVELLSISLDSGQRVVQQFLSSHHLPGRVIVAGSSGVDLQFGVRGIPAFYIVDQEGFITAAWEGWNPRFSTQWRKELNKLLKA